MVLRSLLTWQKQAGELADVIFCIKKLLFCENHTTIFQPIDCYINGVIPSSAYVFQSFFFNALLRRVLDCVSLEDTDIEIYI